MKALFLFVLALMPALAVASTPGSLKALMAPSLQKGPVTGCVDISGHWLGQCLEVVNRNGQTVESTIDEGIAIQQFGCDLIKLDDHLSYIGHESASTSVAPFVADGTSYLSWSNSGKHLEFRLRSSGKRMHDGRATLYWTRDSYGYYEQLAVNRLKVKVYESSRDRGQNSTIAVKRTLNCILEKTQ